MLVAVREVAVAEVQDPPSLSGVCERYYSLYATETSATVVDVTDSRARKTFHFDVHTASNAALTDMVFRPLLDTILTPQRASQAVFVVDGTRAARELVLFGGAAGKGQDGVLAAGLRTLRAHPDVAVVYLGGVTLQDHNQLEDLFAPVQLPASSTAADPPAPEPTILEDTRDCFTAVEEACYQELTDDARTNELVDRLRGSLSETKHQVFSVIVAFRDAAAMPNVTVQYISFAVGELARGMKSTRHCVSTAASLIECQSPVMPFNGTKVSYLLKPALLGHQPGAWVSCLSPVSFLPKDSFGRPAVTLPHQQTPGIPQRETFKEAFSIAQLAGRVYSSRIGVVSPSRCAPPPLPSTAPRCGESVSHAACPPAARPSASSTPCPSHDSGVAPSGPAVQRSGSDGLVNTPAVRPSQPAEVQTPVASPPPQPLQQSAPVAPAVESRTARASVPAAEVEVYKRSMEGAMESLRQTIRDYAKRLAETERDLARERAEASKRATSPDPQADAGAMQELLARNASLTAELKSTQQALASSKAAYEGRIKTMQRDAEAARAQLTGEIGDVLSKLTGAEERDRAVAEEFAILKARVSELMSLVSYHQEEIRTHTEVEKGYRERVLALEQALRQRTADAQDMQRALESARDAKHRAEERLATATAREEVPAMEGKDGGTLSPKEDVHGVVSAMAERLRDALAVAERERQARLSAEAALQAARGRTALSEPGPPATASLPDGHERQLADVQREVRELRRQLSQQQARLEDRAAMQERSTVAPRGSGAQTSDKTYATSGSSAGDRPEAPPSPRKDTVPRPPTSRTDPPSGPLPPTGGRSANFLFESPASAAGYRDRGRVEEPSGLSYRSVGSARGGGGWRSRESSRSFEEFMQQEPEYQVGRLLPRALPSRSSRFRI